MSLQDCKKAYIDLSQKAFTKKNILSQAREKVTVGSKFKTQPLEDAVKLIIGKEWQETLLKEDKDDCKT